MKEHESRIIKNNSSEKVFYRMDDVWISISYSPCILYVDYDNFLHNLNGTAWVSLDLYFIHGKQYNDINEWDIERNRKEILDKI